MQLNFSIADDGPVSLGIYDEMGREIRQLFSGRSERGIHTLHWDGRDASGKIVTSGAYRCLLRAVSRTASIGMLVVE